MDLNRENAWALLTEYTKGESLLKHALAVRWPPADQPETYMRLASPPCSSA